MVLRDVSPAGEVVLRPIRQRDARAWRDLRRDNREWLAPWDATAPEAADERVPGFGEMVRHLREEARQGRALPFVVVLDGRVVGQLSVSGIAYGSYRGCYIGYWIDRSVAGRGIMPTAVALATDHAHRVLRLHRVELAIRPENMPSRRVAEKLGFRLEGVRERYLHINGAWRDHVVYVLEDGEIAEGVLSRWRRIRGGGDPQPA